MQLIKDSMNSLGYKEVILEKLEKTILQNYTSLLQTSAIEYHNCKNCKSILECKNKLEGYAYLPSVKGNEISFK